MITADSPLNDIRIIAIVLLILGALFAVVALGQTNEVRYTQLYDKPIEDGGLEIARYNQTSDKPVLTLIVGWECRAVTPPEGREPTEFDLQFVCVYGGFDDPIPTEEPDAAPEAADDSQ
jgi:hypothetical protein